MCAARRKSGVRRAHKAFTLLEILLVVGLLDLLAAFVVPALTGAADSAKIDLARAAIGANGPLSQSIDLFKVNAVTVNTMITVHSREPVWRALTLTPGRYH